MFFFTCFSYNISICLFLLFLCFIHQKKKVYQKKKKNINIIFILFYYLSFLRALRCFQEKKEKKEKRMPYEVIFRSTLQVLVDFALQESVFVQDFFLGGEGNTTQEIFKQVSSFYLVYQCDFIICLLVYVFTFFFLKEIVFHFKFTSLFLIE